MAISHANNRIRPPKSIFAALNRSKRIAHDCDLSSRKRRATFVCNGEANQATCSVAIAGYISPYQCPFTFRVALCNHRENKPLAHSIASRHRRNGRQPREPANVSRRLEIKRGFIQAKRMRQPTESVRIDPRYRGCNFDAFECKSKVSQPIFSLKKLHVCPNPQV